MKRTVEFIVTAFLTFGVVTLTFGQTSSGERLQTSGPFDMDPIFIIGGPESESSASGEWNCIGACTSSADPTEGQSNSQAAGRDTGATGSGSTPAPGGGDLLSWARGADESMRAPMTF